MGTEYYLFRPDNKTVFELGKGLLNEAFLDYEIARPLPSEEELVQQIEDAQTHYLEAFGRKAPKHGYSALVASRLLEWAEGQPVQFVSEHGLEDADVPLAVAGSRYVGEWQKPAWIMERSSE